MKNVRLVATAVLSIAASPVFAADLADSADIPILESIPSSDWSGFYAGVFGGYAAGTATSQNQSTVGEFDLNGAALGVTLGANAQYDKFVIGAEGDVAWTGVTGEGVCAVNAAFNCSGDISWLATLRARAGLSVDAMLLYATAGVAIADVTAHVTPAPANATGEFSDRYIGWTVGVGAEVKLTDTISMKAEYAYVDLGSRTAPAGTLTTTGDGELSASLHTVKVGLNFAF